jgi:uncharacterized membrane protein
MQSINRTPILVTMVRNVPMNDALEAVAPADAGAAGHWARYVRAWTAWNHVRVLAGAAAAAAMVAAVHVA